MTYTTDSIQRPNSSRNMMKKLALQPYTAIVLLGSFLLSAASFFTTFNGMLDFMEVWLVTFCIVFAIQGLLFVTSWRIGFAAAERERLPLFTSLVFLICLATSVYFSFAALNDYVNDEETRERKRIARIQSAIDGNSATILRQLAADREVAIGQMLTAPSFKDWEDGLDAVTQSAIAARGAIESTREAESDRVKQRIAALRAQRQDILRREAVGTARISTLQGRLRQLEQQRPSLVERMSKLRGEIDSLNEQVAVQEGLMTAEEQGSVSGGASGRGPAWRALRDKRNLLAAERDAKTRILTGLQSQLNTVDSSVAEVSADIAVATGAAAAAQIKEIDTQIAELRKRVASNGGSVALAADVNAMRSALAAFKARQRPDLEDFDKAAGACRAILAEMQRNNATPSGQQLQCEPSSALATPIKGIRSVLLREAQFSSECTRGGVSAPTLSELSFQQAANYGERCVATLSGLTAEQQKPLLATIARIEVEEAPNAKRHIRAVNELVAGDKLAYLSAAIALFIDLLVLFSGIIGALSSSGKLQLALGRILTKGEIEDFERALRPEIAQFILDTQRSFDRKEKVESGKLARLGGRRLQYGGKIDLTDRPGDDMAIRRLKARARAFLIAQTGKGLATLGTAGAVKTHDRREPTTISAGASTDVFLLSDELMRGLRAYIEMPETHRLDGLPRVGSMSTEERRRAARDIRAAARPFRADWLAISEWPYVARADISEIDHTIPPGQLSTPRQNAEQVLLGLYSERLARPERFGDHHSKSSLVYLLNDDALELLDRAARLTEAETEAAKLLEETMRRDAATQRRNVEAETARVEAERRAIAHERRPQLPAPSETPDIRDAASETLALSTPHAGANDAVDRARGAPTDDRSRTVFSDDAAGHTEDAGMEEDGSQEPREANGLAKFFEEAGLKGRHKRFSKRRDRAG